MSEAEKDKAFDAWCGWAASMNQETESAAAGAMRRAFHAGWASKEAADLAVANEERHRYEFISSGVGKSDDGDYDSGYSEAAQEIERRIKESE